MSSFWSAVTDLTVAATVARAPLQEVENCAEMVKLELGNATQREITRSLSRLGDVLAAASPRSINILAQTALALVEQGGEPMLVIPDLMDQLLESLERKPLQSGQNSPEPAAGSLEEAWNVAEVLLSRSLPGRELARGREDLLATMTAVASHQPSVATVLSILQARED